MDIPQLFVKSDCLKKYPFDVSYRIAADYAFFLSMYFQKKSFYEIDTVIAYFRTGGASSNLALTYIESKKVSLQLAKGNVFDAHYRGILDHYKKIRLLPVYSYFLSKFRSGQGRKLRKYFGKQEIVLYGAGQIGKKLLSGMRDIGLNVIAFWDSNSSRHGNILEGVPIQSPCKKNQWQNNAIILLATIKDNDAIAARLQFLGYERGKDFFDGYVDWLGS